VGLPFSPEECCGAASFPSWCECMRVSWASACAQLSVTALSLECVPGKAEEEMLGPKEERLCRSN